MSRRRLDILMYHVCMENNKSKSGVLAALFVAGALAGGHIKDRELGSVRAAEVVVEANTKAAAKARAEKAASELGDARRIITRKDAAENLLITIRDDFRFLGAPFDTSDTSSLDQKSSAVFEKRVATIRTKISNAFHKFGDLNYALKQNNGQLNGEVVKAALAVERTCLEVDSLRTQFTKELETPGSALNTFFVSYLKAVFKTPTSVKNASAQK